MQCRDQESTTSDEINVAIDGILEEDRQERSARDRKRKLNVSQRCEELQERDVLSYIKTKIIFFFNHTIIFERKKNE